LLAPQGIGANSTPVTSTLDTQLVALRRSLSARNAAIQTPLQVGGWEGVGVGLVVVMMGGG